MNVATWIALGALLLASSLPVFRALARRQKQRDIEDVSAAVEALRMEIACLHRQIDEKRGDLVPAPQPPSKATSALELLKPHTELTTSFLILKVADLIRHETYTPLHIPVAKTKPRSMRQYFSPTANFYWLGEKAEDEGAAFGDLEQWQPPAASLAKPN
jgi:hypothetical protein